MKKTILIVDDEMGPRESARMVLKPLYHIEIAEEGKKALKMIDNGNVDLVILDLVMPNLSGEALLKMIKRKSPQIEIVLASGNATLKSAIDGIRFGAFDFIIKPFNTTDLLNIVRRALNKKRRKEELKTFLNEIGDIFGMDVSLIEVINHLKALRGDLEKRQCRPSSSGRSPTLSDLANDEPYYSEERHHDGFEEGPRWKTATLIDN